MYFVLRVSCTMRAAPIVSYGFLQSTQAERAPRSSRDAQALLRTRLRWWRYFQGAAIARLQMAPRRLEESFSAQVPDLGCFHFTVASSHRLVLSARCAVRSQPAHAVVFASILALLAGHQALQQQRRVISNRNANELPKPAQIQQTFFWSPTRAWFLCRL